MHLINSEIDSELIFTKAILISQEIFDRLIFYPQVLNLIKKGCKRFEYKYPLNLLVSNSGFLCDFLNFPLYFSIENCISTFILYRHFKKYKDFNTIIRQ